MVLFAILLVFVGFYALYSTSDKMRIRKKNFIDKGLFKHNNQLVKICGVVLLILAFSVFVIALGWAVGIFSGLVCLMTLASLLVLLIPLNLLKK
ncbi:DUF3325 family protein [Leeuwenhoekiella marinoflava]|uniref:DUF3784 domain-containing protein n=2 Tax=Leeuwenhoekiella marinoflava TaxID=988 RepID=A0A4Q0PN92_9FLAO|nr:DUF3325 family protein [Leeuwenhoekiella marinoflava]RXG31874.1 putative protein DUF3325 [Leeuwenhoekiella marinoflava]SHE89979.1 hypothetical protein SAMN02745246_01234 [Leeuwenhoekiella marinoflava DSM 3653]